MGVVSSDVQIKITEDDSEDFRRSFSFLILFGEFTDSDSMMMLSLPNSFFRNSATFCVPSPKSFILSDLHSGQILGSAYWVLQI